MAQIDSTYHSLLRDVMDYGFDYEDPNRKGVMRKQLTSYRIQHNLRHSFPAITTKTLYWRSVVVELLWFLRGDTNIKYLIDNNVHIWDKDAYNNYKKTVKQSIDQATAEGILKGDNSEGYSILSKESFINRIKTDNKFAKDWGDIGRGYGAQWRNWKYMTYNKKEDIEGVDELISGVDIFDGYAYYRYVDQIQNLIDNLRKNPMSTQHIVTAWNPAELDETALPPCHKGFQIMCYPLSYEERYNHWISNNYETGIEYFCDEKRNPINFEDPYYTSTPKYGFDLIWEQRSVDVFLGLPFNIASYALLAYIIGRIVNMIPRDLIGDLRNVHLYKNAQLAAAKQLSRSPVGKANCVLDISKLRPMKIGMHGKIDNWLSAHDIKDFELIGYESYSPINVEMLPRD